MTVSQSSPTTFLDYAPAPDGDLHLVEPAMRWVRGLLEACDHPLTRQLMPSESRLTEETLRQWLIGRPRGRQLPDRTEGLAPAYHFWMHIPPQFNAPYPIVGAVSLRLGEDADLQMYMGHLGYHVYPAARGRHYAARACQMLLPLARLHGLRSLWITCNPDNIASRQTCELLGARLVEIVRIPANHPLYARGQREKCRYVVRNP